MQQLQRIPAIGRAAQSKLTAAIPIAALDRIHGHALQQRERVGLTFGLAQFGNFRFGAARCQHALIEGQGFAAHRRLPAKCDHQIPVNLVVVLRSGAKTITNGDDLVVVELELGITRHRK